MNKDQGKYMSECMKRGVFIHPDPILYRKVKLIVEFHTDVDFPLVSKFTRKYIEETFDAKGDKWWKKIHELYQIIYEKRIQPESQKVQGTDKHTSI